ncbi:MAG: hypothetical protein MJZ20_10780 [Bacteroidaceae bacterium]|nr:hypothetical protein [Bacteroidaceae bacterium]
MASTNSIINKIYINNTTKEAVSSAPCTGTLYINWTNQAYAVDSPRKYVINIVFSDGSRTLTATKEYTSATTKMTATSEIQLRPEYMPTTTSMDVTIFIQDYGKAGTSSTWNFLGTGPSVNFTLTIPETAQYYPSTIGNIRRVWTGAVRGAESAETYYYITGDTTFTLDYEYAPGAGATSNYVYGLMAENTSGFKDFKLYENPVHYTFTFNNSGTYNILFASTDSRGRTSTATLASDDEVRIWAYQKPTIKVDIVRDMSSDTESIIKCSYSCSRSSLGENDTGNKIRQIHIDRKNLTLDEDWQNDWCSATLSTDSGILTINMNCNDTDSSQEYSYQAHEWAFRAWVDDTIMVNKYSSQSTRRNNSFLSNVVQIQGVAERIINIHRAGDGIAFGKIAQRGRTFECNWDSQLNSNVHFSGDKDGTIILQNMCYPLCMNDDTWGVSSGQTDIKRSNSYKKFGSCSVRFYGSTTSTEVNWIPQGTRSSAYPGQIKPKINNTHIYYVCLWIMQPTKQGAVDIFWPTSSSAILSNGVVSSANEWTKVSAVFNRNECSNGAHAMQIRYKNNSVENTLCADGLAIYDLTSAFGSGNEPNKAWCDANLDYAHQSMSYVASYNFTCDVPTTFNNTVNINNNLTGNYLQGTWLKTTATYDYTGNTSRFCVLDNAGWVYTKTVVDFVVEEGTSGIWSYRKWNSGIAECWGRYAINGVPCNSGVGNWYKTDNIQLPNYPFTFVADPEINMFFETHTGTGGMAWSAELEDPTSPITKIKPGMIYIIRMASSNSISGWVNAKVIGRWK